MTHYIIQRALQVIAVVVLLSFATFVLLFVVGNPVYLLLGEGASKIAIQQLTHELGLDQPVWIQYVHFFRDMMRGNFGVSVYMGVPALPVVLQRVPATLELAVIGLLLTVVIAVSLGVAAAVWRDSWVDYLASFIAFSGQGMPSFWLGIILILVFSVRLHWLPEAGIGGWQHILMPAVTLALYLIPAFTRLTRSRMLEVLGEDYVRTAKAKGLSAWTVWVRHALPNSMSPVVTMLGLQVGNLFGGIVVIETVFGWPGVASIIVSSIQRFDYAVVQAGVVILAIVIAVSNMLADIAVAALDPRVRLGGRV